MSVDIDFLKEVFRENLGADCFVFEDASYTYSWLLNRIDELRAEMDRENVPRGSIVSVHSDFSPDAIAAMLCLIERGDILVPIAPSSAPSAPQFAQLAQIGCELRFSNGGIHIERRPTVVTHPLLRQLVNLGHSGLVLFSSGTTGEPKGVVHDFTKLLRKYRTRRHCHRTLAFLLFDHIGGIDTALYSLSNASCLVLVKDRSPEKVCEAIERHRVAVLPAAPTFLNLLAISGAWQRHDLSSLEIVTYGAEVMPEDTLRRCRSMFPGVTLMQKYGTSEVGALRSKSRSSDSLWVKLGGEGYETRVVGGMLEIKAESSMLGYLNADSPFTEDGWFRTGDLVEVDGEFLRFLGRESDVINVGGRKVNPAEVEGVIAALPNVAEVVVFGVANPVMGQVVHAVVRTVTEEDAKLMQRRIRSACLDRLERYKVPMTVQITKEPLTTQRFKRRRAAPAVG